MILYKDFNKPILRWGNLAFGYAFMLGCVKKYGEEIQLPEYYMFKYFQDPPTLDVGLEPEVTFHFRKYEFDPEYVDEFFYKNKGKIININLNPLAQSARNFEHCVDYVVDKFKIKEEVISRIKNKYQEFFTKPTIGISIRKGDFVNHGVFYQIRESWYLDALYTYFPNYKDFNIIIFSDDIEWCKQYYKGHNFFFCEPNNTHTHADSFKHYHNDAHEQYVLGTLMDNMIIGSSTFSWQQAFYGATQRGGLVIHSGENFRGEHAEKNNIVDYYYKNWTIFPIENN